MNKFLNALGKPAKWILLIGSALYALLFAIMTFAQIDGNFFSVMASLIIGVVGFAVLAAVPLFILLKKENISKIVFSILAGYWLISSFLGEVGAGYNIDNGNPGIFNAACVFSFIFGLTLLAVAALLVLSFVLKKDLFRLIALGALAIAIFMALVAGILWLSYFGYVKAEYDMNTSWVRVLSTICDYFFLPLIVSMGYLYFYGAPQQD